MSFIANHQLNVMLFMSGMCGILAVMTLLTKTLPVKTKRILVFMEISAMLLLLFDRFAYKYRGDVSTLGFYMVRISNGMVYILSLIIPCLVTRFLYDMFKHDANLDRMPIQLIIADWLYSIGTLLVIISQFTGLYYTFDENNVYHRSPLNFLCYAAPFLMVVMQEWSIIRYRKKIKKSLAVSMLICIALPVISSVIQIFLYGISLANMMTAFVVCVFYSYALSFLSETVERARQHEIEVLIQTQKKETALFRQTAEALANAIDAKDKYTRGHSTRVASYAELIAQEAGLSAEECYEVYFAGLLHDIGKIGISDEIINKNAKLTDGEYMMIKSHTELGNQILSSIENAPYLADGAHYHHERYDGKGYPTGLSGTDIPRVARIIAVADSYDAMTSVRTYNVPLDINAAREELVRGIGKQFDPEYAEIMIRLIDEEE